MKKRIISTLLALLMIVTLLPLGLVEPAEAAETQDAQRKEVTERAQAYIAACNSFSAQNGQSIPYWTISDAEFEGYVQTKTRDKAAETSKLKKQVDAGDFMSALTTKTCTGSNGSHQWSNEKYTCRSHYFSGLDNRGGGYSQCQGFANYMAYVLFGEAGTSESNFTKMTQVGYGFDFQPGDVLRVLDSNGKNGHSMVVYEGSGSSAKVIECNWGHSSRGYCNVRWDLTVAQKQKQFPTVETVWRPNASLAVTPSGTDSGGGTTEDVIDSGNCGANGANVTWKLTSDGTLTISGTGKMADYEWEGTPWYDLRSQVKKAVIKNAVTSIGKYAFSYCEALTSVSIPDGVISIGFAAFENCSLLTGVTIPNSVTGIGDWAFNCCTSLTSVTIPNSVTNIGWAAFGGCTSLTSVTIPNSVISIGDWAFGGCTSLTSMTIPESVTSIDAGAFAGCSISVNVSRENKNYCSVDGGLYDKKKTTIFHPGKIQNGVFRIPDGVTSIGSHAFCWCENLTSVTIPSGVTTIGDYAFRHCTSLKGVTIPGSVTSIGEYAFSNCTSLTSVTIPKSLRYIYQDAFHSCDSLTDVYYDGTAEDWAKIVIDVGNEDLTNAKLHAATIFTPANVELVGATPAANSITVTWQAVENASTYTVYRKPAGTSSWAIIAKNVSGTSYPDKSVTAGESYTYTVRGVAADGKTMSKGYDTKGVTAKVPAAVFVPANVTMKNAAVSGSSIVVTWQAAENASAYTVYRKPAGTSSWAIIAKNVSGTSYPDKSVTAGESYTYTVRGVAADGRTMSKGYDTKGVTAKVPAAVSVPANVTMKNAAVSGSSIVVTWQAAENASAYTVYRKPAGTNSWAIIAKNVSGTSYTDKSVTAGESYTYTVRGVAADGRTMSKGYDTKGVTAKVPAAVSVPANVTLTAAKADSAGILVTWEAAANAQTYTVYRKLTGTNSWAIVARSVAGTVWKDINADKGLSYTYTVRGVAADGRTMSKGYDTKGVTDQVTKAITTPANVTMTAASSSGTSIAVTWEYALDAKTYVVYRKPAGTNSWAIIARNVSGTSYTDKSVTAGESYTYTVRGVAADGRTMSKGYDAKGVTAKAFAVAASSVTG